MERKTRLSMSNPYSLIWREEEGVQKGEESGEANEGL